VIEFMVIGLPRSGTAWAANWLTTDTTQCLHDPIAKHHHADLDAIASAKRLGVACTGLWMHQDWLNAHPAKKVILHRDQAEVAQSLDSLGFPDLPFPSLDGIGGLHVDWRDLWSNPKPLWAHLVGTPFDAERHRLLKELNVQVDFDRVTVDRTAAARYLEKFA
jgi:hypothetical protein